jgi:hypothetical protein
MMDSRKARTRRIAILAALALPVLILLQGFGSVDAQFPKGPPGGMPPGGMPPGGMPGGKGFGPKNPLGGGPTFEWRCSKCNALIGTGSKPNVASCPNCGVNFINGGKGLLPPPNGGGMPPAGQPPIGGGQPPVGGMPPVGQPPVGQPPMGQPPVGQPPIGGLPPADPLEPVGAPNNDAFAPAPGGPPRVCTWCSGDVSPGNSYCGACKVKVAFGVIAGILAAVVLVVGIVATILYVCLRGNR